MLNLARPRLVSLKNKSQTHFLFYGTQPKSLILDLDNKENSYVEKEHFLCFEVLKFWKLGCAGTVKLRRFDDQTYFYLVDDKMHAAPLNVLQNIVADVLFRVQLSVVTETQGQPRGR